MPTHPNAMSGDPLIPRVAIRRGLAQRFGLLLSLGAAQLIILSFLYDLPAEFANAVAPIRALREVVHFAILAFAAFCVVVWPRRRALLTHWHTELSAHSLLGSVTLNLVVFACAAVATWGMSQAAAFAPESFWHYLVPYFLLLGLLIVSLAGVFAPLAFWRDLVRSEWIPIAFSTFLGLLVLGLSEMAKGGWEDMASATLNLTHWMLGFIGTDVQVDTTTRALGMDGFAVIVAPDCSGYEGIGLVIAFLVLYMAAFRRELAFPNALLLFPIGIATIWLFNALRIAILITIGAYVSPWVAINGFHSQAGWISFLLVTIGIMWIGYKVPFFKRAKAGTDAPISASIPAQPADTPADDTALVWLAPFMALMAASIAIAAFSPDEHALYGLRVMAVGGVLWLFRSFYATLIERISPLAIVAGLAVGVAWIATDPDPAGNDSLRTWIAALHPSVLIGWLIFRAAGTIVFVPIAEELAFRGYLFRVIQSIKSTALSPAILTLIAIVVSSLVFGAIHQRWLAAAAAGVVYALLLVRSGRVSDAIVAHMVTNALIFLWAYHQEQWSLL